MLGVMPLFRGHERGRFFPCAGLACASLRGAMAFWIFFHNALDIPIYLGLLSTCPAPPRGALEGAQVCGAAEGGAGDAALSFRGLAGQTPAGLMRWPCSVLRGTGGGGPSRAVPGRAAALHSGPMEILVHLVQSHQRGHAAAQGFVQPAVDRHLTRKGWRLKRSVHRGPHGASLKHRARDAGEPGTSWWLLLCTPVTLCVHRLRGVWRSPVSRAPSDFSRSAGRRKQAAPGAFQIIRAAERWLFDICV